MRQLADIDAGRDRARFSSRCWAPQPRPFRKGRLDFIGVKVGDESGHVRATWFNQPWVADKLTPGAQLLLTGKRTNAASP